MPATKIRPGEPMAAPEISGDQEVHPQNLLFEDVATDLRSVFNRRIPKDDTPETTPKKHVCYYKWCERPDCQIEGHVSRRGHVFVDVASGGPDGAAQVADVLKSTHGTSLEGIIGPVGGWRVNNNSATDPEYGLYWAGYNDMLPWGPFSELFNSPGGIYKMPADQFIELGFHRDPDLIIYRPDVQRLVDSLYRCDLCPPGKVETMDFNLLEKHRTVAHKERVASMAMGREIVAALKQVGFTGENHDQALMALIVQQQKQLADMAAEFAEMKALAAPQQQVKE